MALSMAVLALSCWPYSAVVARAQAPRDRAPSRLESTVDSTIAPGDDFFGYANGAWLKTAVIPAGRDRWAVRDDINEITRRQLLAILEGTSAPHSLARKVADFRAAMLADSMIEQRGIAALAPTFARIDRVVDARSLALLLGGTMHADVHPLDMGDYTSSSVLGFAVEHGIHGEQTYDAILVQGGLALGERDAYLDDEPDAAKQRQRYQQYIARMLTLAGFDHADRRAESVLALETAIARSHSTHAMSANDHNADSLWTRARFASRAPGMDWTVFLEAAGLGTQESIVAWQPSAITGVAALVASQPLDTWKDYLRARVVDTYADVLPREVAVPAAALHAAALGRSSPMDSRSRRAVDATQAALGDVIGRLYVERHFPTAQKARVRRIVDDVTAAFIARVERATWMSAPTKALAVAKLKTLYVGIGYPEQWTDDSALVVDPSAALANVRRVADRDRRRALARLGCPVEMKAWLISPQTAGAVLVFQQNAYDFAAALLQPPKFDAAWDDAAAYGAIGAIIGHDVSHFVDVLGADYDADGAMRHWWTADDASRFRTLAEPLARQFSAYRPFPDASIDGALTQTENIADLAGLASAFDAYRAALGARASDRSYVRRHDREFFIAFAQSWRTRATDAALRAQLSSDHAPERYRVATVRNLDAWYDAFDVRPGQRLYLEPAARVRVW